MLETRPYQFLEGRPDSRFRQLFVKGRKYTAERVYRETVGEDPRTPEEVAQDLDLPLGAVLEAIDYCTHNEALLRQEREEELARLQDYDRRQSPLRPPDGGPKE